MKIPNKQEFITYLALTVIFVMFMNWAVHAQGFGWSFYYKNTYRTMCVRLCDGFYYPISFATIPRQFKKDRNICRTNCSSRAELFVYKNPGEFIRDMKTINGFPYTRLRNAFRHHREYVPGCTCKWK